MPILRYNVWSYGDLISENCSWDDIQSDLKEGKFELEDIQIEIVDADQASMVKDPA